MESREQMKELEELGKPLVKWINDNRSPHAKIVITCDSVELLGGDMRIPVPEYIEA